MKVIDFGIKRYEEVLSHQERLFTQLIESKKRGDEGEENVMIGEHYPVITLGRRAKESNVLLNQIELKERGIKTYHIGRGGDVTYHGPGQMIVYPIIDLERHKLGVKEFVSRMEEAVIRLLDRYGIEGERVDGATGVWLGKGSDKERKICAMGIKCSRYCTMHGLALNVTTDLKGFSMINPCGFQDKGVTSLNQEVGDRAEALDIKEVKKEFLDIFLGLIFPFEKVFDFTEKL